MRLFLFFSVFLSVTNGKSLLAKPYNLALQNSRAMSELRHTKCWPNLHFLLLEKDLHWLAKLPTFRALMGSQIPAVRNAVLDWLTNLKNGPAAAKGNSFNSFNKQESYHKTPMSYSLYDIAYNYELF